jgi:hypothetical protein
MTEFNVKFAAHLALAQISNLKGILLFKGIEGNGSNATFVLLVSRSSRVSGVATTLNNWVAAGWVEEWMSIPPLTQ